MEKYQKKKRQYNYKSKLSIKPNIVVKMKTKEQEELDKKKALVTSQVIMMLKGCNKLSEESFCEQCGIISLDQLDDMLEYLEGVEKLREMDDTLIRDDDSIFKVETIQEIADILKMNKNSTKNDIIKHINILFKR